MGSQRTRGTHSKAHRQSTCLADAMAGRRTPSVCRSPPREAAPGSSAAGRAGALRRGLPLSLSPRPADGPQRGRPGPPAAAAEFGAEDRSPPPPGCAALPCTGLGRLPARSRSPPPWPRAPPCGPRRDCSGTGRAPGRRLSAFAERRRAHRACLQTTSLQGLSQQQQPFYCGRNRARVFFPCHLYRKACPAWRSCGL